MARKQRKNKETMGGREGRKEGRKGGMREGGRKKPPRVFVILPRSSQGWLETVYCVLCVCTHTVSP